ncbi:(2Fe-2S)-binding protein [Haloferax sp. DFSO52]|uniref:(2Fe-2S)-binding protein n=1 Tax=Haloferax sp. DFSO52 TaxID=3388505 RepID=UPI003A8C84B0
MTTNNYSSTVTTTINGDEVVQEVPDRKLLVHFLREDAGCTGVHQGCVVGKCGACTVVVDGTPMKSCMMYSMQVDGKDVMTARGLAAKAEEEGIAVEDNGELLHPIQKGFKEKHGLQCGYCTPGFVLSTYGLLSENDSPTEEDIENAVSGNICRCTGYNSIVESIEWAADELRSRQAKTEPADD